MSSNETPEQGRGNQPTNQSLDNDKNATFPVHHRLRTIAKGRGETWDIGPDDLVKVDGIARMPFWVCMGMALKNANNNVQGAVEDILGKIRTGRLVVS